MVKLTGKITASTLMESLISMVLIVTCFSIAIMVYVNVVTSTNLANKAKATLLLNKELINAKNEKQFLDQEYNSGEFFIKKRFLKYKDAEDVRVLRIEVEDKEGVILARRNELHVVGE